jgi:BON domain-containing protein
MANRNQDYSNRPGSQSGSRSWRDDDENGYEQGRSQYGGPRERDINEQSGSTGRHAGYGDFGRGDYGGGRSGWSGQERHGQGGHGQGNYSTGDYGRRSEYGYGGSAGSIERSRFGQGQGQSGGRSWNEPYGEGQQYTPRGEYSGERGEYGEEWTRPQGQGQGYGNPGYGRSQGYGPQGSGVGYAGQGYGYGSQQGTGEHRGKGPKGYQRSDERIKEMLCERLRDDPAIDPSEVTITVQGGVITLEGTVDSRQTKNAIEEIAEQFGTQDVQSNLRVQRSPMGQQSSTDLGRQGRGSDESGASRPKQH